MAKKTKKKKIRKRIIIWSLIILFILYVSIFVVLRPFMGEITQDRPIMRVLCETYNNQFNTIFITSYVLRILRV